MGKEDDIREAAEAISNLIDDMAERGCPLTSILFGLELNKLALYKRLMGVAE